MDCRALQGLYAYHHWATDRLLAVLASVSDAELARPLGGSFGTARALLCHVLGAEWLWLERFRGRSPAGWPDLSACHGAVDFRREWEAIKAEHAAVLTSLTPAALTTPLTYTNLLGRRFSYPFEEVLLHVVNHGTYHRGQLAHILRQLGHRPPATDYLVYRDEQQSAGDAAPAG